jgi:hypothetical protein
MEFTLSGFQVYSPEVDDRCIDFVTRKGEGPYYEVQVKALSKGKYACLPKALAPQTSNRRLALAGLAQQNGPLLYLIPMTDWKKPNALLVSRDYEGERSRPEWGINLSGKTSSLLEAYRFEDRVKKL